MTATTPQDALRDAFDRANHSTRLEGVEVSAEGLALQERVIKGELTFDQAVQETLKAAISRKALRSRRVV